MHLRACGIPECSEVFETATKRKRSYSAKDTTVSAGGGDFCDVLTFALSACSAPRRACIASFIRAR
jgi:hypothetical protein